LGAKKKWAFSKYMCGRGGANTGYKFTRGGEILRGEIIKENHVVECSVMMGEYRRISSCVYFFL